MSLQNSPTQQKNLLAVIVVLVVTNITVLMLYFNQNSTLMCHTTVIERTSSCNTDKFVPRARSAPFTVDDQLFIYYGEGRSDTEDESLLRYIDTHVSRPNSSRPRALRDTTGKKDFSQIGQSEFVDNRLKQRRNGFYVECGAFDGEGLSNSLFFELERNWTGLLIEANPSSYRALLKKNRNSLALNACLSNKRTPGRLSFRPANVLGGIVENIKVEHNNRINSEKLGEGDNIQVECFSLNSIMAALGVSHIDYLSLDVEGAEVEILQTIDWDKLRIDILTIEYPVSTGALEGIRNVFKPLSMYKEVGGLAGQDVIFERISS